MPEGFFSNTVGLMKFPEIVFKGSCVQFAFA
jgi:hypothetical protein